MTSPRSLAGDGGSQNNGPSSSKLQELQEEIRTSGIPTSSQAQRPSRGNSRTTSVRNTTSVWIGGNNIAQDARQKLRAADQERYKKKGRSEKAVTAICKQRPSLWPPCSDAGLKSSQSISDPQIPTISVSNVKDSERRNSSLRLGLPGDVPAMFGRPTIGGLRLPASATVNTLPCWANDTSASLELPLIICDIDSDISITPSPTEPPTSAFSCTLTDISTDTNEALQHPSEQEPCRAPKRPRSRAESPKVLSKKARTLTLPTPYADRMTSQESISDPSKWSFPGDNYFLVHNTGFTERSCTINDSPATRCSSPSSFRPKTVDAHGLPSNYATPARPSTRCTTPGSNEKTPELDETPPFARALQLVDAEISIFKKVHGDECDEKPLCLWCFRTRGRFGRIGEHGYELCDKEEVLKGHYWESYGDYAE